MVNIVSTGSTGNAVIYNNSILVDCGVPYSEIKPFIKDLKIVLLTHRHGDHINITTLKRMQFERPSLRIGCCDWMLPFVCEFKNLDVYKIGEVYDYKSFKISPIKLYHDVENCGYRLFIEDKKIIHATDTAHLEGISANKYDFFCIESNYNEDTIWESIQNTEAKGLFSHQRGSINSHLSEQQCNEFYYKNKGDKSTLIRLHLSNTK